MANFSTFSEATDWKQYFQLAEFCHKWSWNTCTVFSLIIQSLEINLNAVLQLCEIGLTFHHLTNAGSWSMIFILSRSPIICSLVCATNCFFYDNVEFELFELQQCPIAYLLLPADLFTYSNYFLLVFVI